MTNRRKRAYEIIIISLVAILMSLCAYMGITAIQKSMTLKLKFNATPQIYCKLAVGETVLFDNKTLEVHPLSTLSGNTLTFDASVFSSDLGVTSFSLTITNYSTTLNDIGITFENATIQNNASNSTVITLDNSETLQITPTGIVEVTMKKVVPINLGLTGVSINYAESNLFEDGGHYAPIGENLKIVIDLEDNYENPQYSLGGNSQGAVSGNTITIDSSNISAGVNLNIQAQQQAYTIIFNGNGADGEMEDAIFNIGSSYNLPANIFTKTEHNFTGWKDSGGNSYTDQQSVKDLAGAGETITLTAQWQVKTYTFKCYLDPSGLVDEKTMYFGVIITNDPLFEMGRSGDYVAYKSSKATTYQQLEYVEPGSKPITTNGAHADFVYIEEYTKKTNQDAVYEFSRAVPAGYKIFIFTTNSLFNNNTAFKSLSSTKSIAFTFRLRSGSVSTVTTTCYEPGGYEQYIVLAQFGMPSDDLNITLKGWGATTHSGGSAD